MKYIKSNKLSTWKLNIITLLCFTVLATMMSCSKDTPVVDNGGGDTTKPNPDKLNYVSDKDKSINLSVVYFYPKGTSPLPRYQRRLSDILTFYQKFYADEFEYYGYDPKTFGVLRDAETSLVKIVLIQGKETDYTKGSGNSVINEVNAYLDAHPEDVAGPVKVIFQRGARGDSGSNFNTGGALPFTGLNQTGYLIDYKEFDMRHFRTGTDEGNVFKIGSELHEFSHMMGIPHDRELYSQTNDWECLMSGGGGSMSEIESAGRVHITKAAVSILDSHPLFNDSAAPYFKNKSVEILNLRAYVDNNVIKLNAKLASDTKINYLSIYHDAEPSGVNKDYDAITWVAPVAEDGSVSLDMPISEFYPAGSTDPMLIAGKGIEMVMRFLHDDGSITSASYPYNINSNGIPDININVKGVTTTIPESGSIQELNRSNWTVISATTEENGRDKEYLIDNNIDTFWHSRWSSEPIGGVPEILIIDMGQEQTVNGFTFVQRQQPDPNNINPLKVHCKDITIEISSDNTNWTKLDDYQLQQTEDLQAQALEAPETFRYFRVTVNTAYSSSSCALAEIGVYTN